MATRGVLPVEIALSVDTGEVVVPSPDTSSSAVLYSYEYRQPAAAYKHNYEILGGVL